LQPPAPKTGTEVRRDSYGWLASSRGRSVSAANELTHAALYLLAKIPDLPRL